MIDKEKFKSLLSFLEFEEKGNVFSKHIPLSNCLLKVDFDKSKIIYPEKLKVWGDFTTNFSSNENFVVFECVHRLLEKGYMPEHIELEPKWDLGRGASGGRADILVYNQKGMPLLIIECKTAGREFEKEWKEMLIDGGQLFSYIEQEKAIEFVCLYASDFDEDKEEINIEQRIVRVKDNEEILLTDSKLKPFKEANNVKERYRVWKDTYQKERDMRGIFEKNIPAYSIGKAHYTLEDLHIIAENDIQKKYHEFATILRQHNVSGRENAFDKLVNLFLAKIVDEKHHPQNLEFRWRGIATDNYFSFIDRLEKLYTNGMKEFLKEDVTFVEQSMVIDAFKYVKNDPDATRETVLKHFRRQKYFTNNDFSFIDVHNEKLFYQNVVILRQMVQMIENVQLNGDQQNQFLGDLFEGFLDRGVKQSEGQFFTPMPIVKFILMSLPLKHLVENSSEIPKAIDYACGAGHFLTELAAQLKTVVEETKIEIPAKEFYSNLYGIEKEYRLSKVAKVSAFMYSQDDINIYYADALTPHIAIKNESFDLLVANPPFAVKGFLETLNEEERNAFSLTQQISDLSKNNNIQCFFLERAKQLLKVGGMTGIIVPSSILSNSDTTHIATREMLLQYFDIVALTELGNRTFGKTGTNTVVLFLRKKDNNPPPDEHYKERVESWFSTNDAKKQAVYIDQHFIEKYCLHIDIAFDDYKKLLHASDNIAFIEPLMQYEIFKDYQTAFKKTEDKIRDTQRKELFRKEKEWTNKYIREHAKATEKEIKDFLKPDLITLSYAHNRALDKAFIDYLQKIEKDKLYYFVLAKTNPQKVLIVKSPADNAAQKKFLGYDWSGSKGSEGIKYLASATVLSDEDEDDRVLQNLNAKRAINTPLFDNNKAENPAKINYYIQQNFLKAPLSIPLDLQSFLSLAHLVDLLDFSRKDFNKAFSLTSNKKTTIESKWELVKLGEVAVIKKGKSITQKDTKEGSIKVVAGGIDFAYLHDESNRPANTITISASGANAGFVNFWREPIFASDCTTVIGKSSLETFYFFNFLKYIQEYIYTLARGSAQPHVYPDDISNLRIPLPPLSIQQQIVAECEAIDNALNQAKTAMIQAKEAIDEIVESVNHKGYPIKKLGDISRMQAGKFVSASDINDEHLAGLYPCYGGNGLRGYTKTFTHEGTYSLIGRQGALCGNVNKANGKFHATEHAVVVTPNPDIHVDWFYYQLKSLNLNQYATGVAQPGLSVLNILSVTTTVPPLSIQAQLVNEIEQLEKRIAESQKIISEAASLKQGVMKKYL